jgi:3-oxoadipate enol-lactonase
VIPPGHSVELPGGGSTYIRDVGDNGSEQPVLLLHGLGVTGGINWGGSLDHIAQSRRAIAMDLRGHGRGLASPFSLQGCADDAIALLDALDIDRALIAGYSMGGPISQLLARDHPDRVVGLVQCATATSFIDPFSPNAGLTVGALAAIASDVPTVLRNQLMKFVWRDGPRPGVAEIIDELRPVDRAAILTAAAACVRFNSTGWFSDLDVPVAAVVTTRDAVVPAYRQLKMVRDSRDHTVHLVDGDHMVCVRHPEAFARQLVLGCESVSVRAQMRYATDQY